MSRELLKSLRRFWFGLYFLSIVLILLGGVLFNHYQVLHVLWPTVIGIILHVYVLSAFPAEIVFPSYFEQKYGRITG